MDGIFVTWCRLLLRMADGDVVVHACMRVCVYVQVLLGMRQKGVIMACPAFSANSRLSEHVSFAHYRHDLLVRDRQKLFVKLAHRPKVAGSRQRDYHVCFML
jgi:hypothetical protein